MTMGVSRSSGSVDALAKSCWLLLMLLLQLLLQPSSSWLPEHRLEGFGSSVVRSVELDLFLLWGQSNNESQPWKITTPCLPHIFMIHYYTMRWWTPVIWTVNIFISNWGPTMVTLFAWMMMWGVRWVRWLCAGVRMFPGTWGCPPLRGSSPAGLVTHLQHQISWKKFNTLFTYANKFLLHYTRKNTTKVLTFTKIFCLQK